MDRKMILSDVEFDEIETETNESIIYSACAVVLLSSWALSLQLKKIESPP